ncbi:MAG: hypothetical protein Q8R02_23090 [Hyphomonadaceae bacterium]|nr:hypothetical protein [Hyphomonadaceae bacterium]
MRTVIIAFIAGSLPLLSYAHPNVPKGERTQPPKVEMKGEKIAEAVKPKQEMPLCASPEISTWNPAVAGWMCQPTLWAGTDAGKAG